MKHSRFVDDLAKFLVYILGRQPDEFGLVPDGEGYVKIKDLMKVMGEEPGWRHVRLNHLREVIHTTRSAQIEMENNLIRAVDRSRLFSLEIPDTLPKLMYYPIRRRAYPVVLEKGVPPDPTGNRIILAGHLALAQRLGRRIDPDPVILTVHSGSARNKGASVWRFGKNLFVTDGLPLGSFNGPPLPKQPMQAKKAEKPTMPVAPQTPGSYLLNLTTADTRENRLKKSSRLRKNEWKRERKRKSRNTS